jgi:hypothetical protein
MANVDVELGHRYFDIVKDAEHIEYHVLQQEQEKEHKQAVSRRVENEDQNSLSQRTTPLFPKQQVLLYTKIERLMKAFKGHRCALDFDRGVVHSELRNAKI